MAPRMTFYGTVAAGGYAIPITYMAIRGGTIHVTAVRQGPIPAYNGPAVIIGQDGTPLASDIARTNVSWPDVPADKNLVLPIPLSLETEVHAPHDELESATRRELTAGSD